MTQQELGTFLDKIAADIQGCRDDLYAIDVSSSRAGEELNAIADRLGGIKGELRDANPMATGCPMDELVAREDSTT